MSGVHNAKSRGVYNTHWALEYQNKNWNGWVTQQPLLLKPAAGSLQKVIAGLILKLCVYMFRMKPRWNTLVIIESAWL